MMYEEGECHREFAAAGWFNRSRCTEACSTNQSSSAQDPHLKSLKSQEAVLGWEEVFFLGNYTQNIFKFNEMTISVGLKCELLSDSDAVL